MKKSNPALLLTVGDPWGSPTGGQATFAKHLLSAFGSSLAVSSHCDDESIPVGQWIERPYANSPIWFFNRGATTRRKDFKPLIPARFFAYFRAIKFLPLIRQMEFGGLLIDSPEMVFAASSYTWKSVCYSFAGVNNPIANSRYLWARALGGYFEQYHIAVLDRMKPNVMIAAADYIAIEEFHTRTGNVLSRTRFHQFPTRVDTDLFYPIDSKEARRNLGLPFHKKIFVTTGRLCWIKGWDLLIEAFVHLKKTFPDAVLIFVGDGEDHKKVVKCAKAMGVSKNIIITGFIPPPEVVQYMNAADVCLVGSHKEGWSVAMCEMIACGKAVVSTDVSGAKDMITDGQNGFVISGRDPHVYAEAICNTLKLKSAKIHSLRLSENYSLKYLSHELGAIWKPLGPELFHANSNDS